MGFSDPTVLSDAQLVIEAHSPIPTKFGDFEMVVFRHGINAPQEHVAMLSSSVAGDDVPVRIHSECMTSEVFGSLKCDCAEQLDLALSYVADHQRGLVIYLRQEGRGIGLINKVRAYALQAKGADTVDANRALGLPDDARKYDAAAAMLRHLGVKSVRLMTNNPAKVDALSALGIEVRGRIPSLVASNRYSAHYLDAKRDRMHHILPAGLSVGDAE